jgi:hypothetical protein
MRNYDCFRMASFLDGNLRSIHRGQKRWEDCARNEFCPFSKLREKLFFYYQMLRMNEVLRRAVKGGHVSVKDYCKLVRLWLKVLVRKYRIA